MPPLACYQCRGGSACGAGRCGLDAPERVRERGRLGLCAVPLALPVPVGAPAAPARPRFSFWAVMVVFGAGSRGSAGGR